MIFFSKVECGSEFGCSMRKCLGEKWTLYHPYDLKFYICHFLSNDKIKNQLLYLSSVAFTSTLSSSKENNGILKRQVSNAVIIAFFDKDIINYLNLGQTQ